MLRRNTWSGTAHSESWSRWCGYTWRYYGGWRKRATATNRVESKQKPAAQNLAAGFFVSGFGEWPHSAVLILPIALFAFGYPFDGRCDAFLVARFGPQGIGCANGLALTMLVSTLGLRFCVAMRLPWI